MSSQKLPIDSLREEIRLMATNCAVCERDARDAEQNLGVVLDLGGIAHPEDAFAYDLMPHRREFHRAKLLRKIREWAALRQQCC
jgi:hypothetical protein